jgi:hypothetical protein
LTILATEALMSQGGRASRVCTTHERDR